METYRGCHKGRRDRVTAGFKAGCQGLCFTMGHCLDEKERHERCGHYSIPHRTGSAATELGDGQQDGSW